MPEDYTGENFCADIQLHPTGRFLYGSNRGHDTILSATILDDGTLTDVALTPSGGAWPWNLAITPDGRFLLAANQRGDCVTSFSVDPRSGALSATGHRAAVPRPVCLAVR